MGWHKITKKVSHAFNKYKRELIGITTFGASEAARELSGYNQAKRLEALTDEQAALQEKQLQINAANQQFSSQQSEQQALAQLMRKSALARTINTGDQPRGNKYFG